MANGYGDWGISCVCFSLSVGGKEKQIWESRGEGEGEEEFARIFSFDFIFKYKLYLKAAI